MHKALKSKSKWFMFKAIVWRGGSYLAVCLAGAGTQFGGICVPLAHRGDMESDAPCAALSQLAQQAVP